MGRPPSPPPLLQTHAATVEGLSQQGSSAGQDCSRVQQLGEDEQTMDTERRTERIRPGQECETLNVRDVPSTLMQVKGAAPQPRRRFSPPQLSRDACPQIPGSVIPGPPGGAREARPRAGLCSTPSTCLLSTVIPAHMEIPPPPNQATREGDKPPGKVASSRPTPKPSLLPSPSRLDNHHQKIHWTPAPDKQSQPHLLSPPP